MRLISLMLRNFKGIKEFTLYTNGGNISVHGDNATGKTTLFDAFLWLLFGKDSQNKADFAIKTLDQNGKEIHFLDHEVEALLEVDGDELTLKKIYREKWVKKKGSPKPEFDGHNIDYFINDVPLKKSEFDSRIKELVDENVFKLLTSPGYFNEQLSWKERRRILLEICGDISDSEVISFNPDLAELREILGNRSLEEHRKIISAKMREINKELERIPVRIDEVQRTRDEIQRSLPDDSEFNKEWLDRQLSMLNRNIRETEAELVRLQTGGEIAVKEKRLRELQAEMLEIKNNLQANKMEEISHIGIKAAELKSQLSEIMRDIEDKKRMITQGKEILADYQVEINNLRQEFAEVNRQTLEFEQEDMCPTCGQAMPFEKLEAAREKAEAEFNRKKAKRLEEIRNKASSISEKGKKLQAELIGYADEAKKLKAEQATKEAELTEAEQRLTKLRDRLKDEEISSEYIQKRAEEVGLKQEITRLKNSSAEAVSSVQAELDRLRQTVANYEADKALLAQVKNANARIKELTDQEQKLSAEFERLEGQMFLTEEFIRTKVNLLEEKINSKFKMARFKLFETQINGGLVETCETLYEGVPYSGGLNNAAKINVGLDIINTLSKHYGFSAPIFIDNREAVTKLIDTDSQVISLIVSEKDKKLRVEPVEKKKEAV